MGLWPSSALSICQYTNRHPVHLSTFFIVSRCWKMKQLALSLWLFDRMCVSESALGLGWEERCVIWDCPVSMLPARVLCPYGRGGVAPSLSSPSLLKEQTNTHFPAWGHQYTTSQVFNTAILLSCRQRKRNKYLNWGPCSFTGMNKLAWDSMYYVAETN